MCAKDNMFVVNCTTPANLFHVLRRQLKAKYRKPLIIFSPKSLLRHPDAVSQISDFTDSSFKTIIDDSDIEVKNIKTVVFCSGKFYYDLFKERKIKKRENNVALIRVEQLFPLPEKEIKNLILKYKFSDDFVWAQEEPRNMGAWSHLLLHLPEAKKMRIASRRMYGTPAAGSSTRFKKRHKEVIDYVFDRNKDNFIRKVKK
jgi:2-oxoglutarate dehydrogenase E1 component